MSISQGGGNWGSEGISKVNVKMLSSKGGIPMQVNLTLKIPSLYLVTWKKCIYA